MKYFENPEIEVINFKMIDVITTSEGGEYVPGENETPLG